MRVSNVYNVSATHLGREQRGWYPCLEVKMCLEANQTHFNGIQRDNKIVLLLPQLVGVFESIFLVFISATIGK